jgi:putative oxidoreductase
MGQRKRAHERACFEPLNKLTNMKTLLQTNGSNTAALIARLAVAITIFPHGAQKLLGWFGGYGFDGFISYVTGSVGAPWILGFLVVIVEFFAPILLALGLYTRLAALALAFNFIGVLVTSMDMGSFFMNWGAVAGQGEGLEYFILLFGLIGASLLMGGGRASVDAALMRKSMSPAE